MKICVLAASLCLCATPLEAQLNNVNPSIPFTGGDATHVKPPYEPAVPPDSVSMPPVERARYTLNSYAVCLVQRDRKAVVSTLAIPVGSPKSAKALLDLAVDDCMGGTNESELRMNGGLLRGALFRALYRADFWRAAPTLSPDQINYSSDIGGGDAGQSGQYVALRQYSECVVRADTQDVRGAIMSATASKNERDYISALTPSMSACLAKGAELKFSKSVLLGSLVEVLYRLSVQTSPAGRAPSQ